MERLEHRLLLSATDPNDQVAEVIAAGGFGAVYGFEFIPGEIAESTDVNLYALDVAAGQSLVAYLYPAGPLSFRPEVRLFDAAGRFVKGGNALAHPSYQAGQRAVAVEGVAAGRYYLGVSAAGNVSYDAATGGGDTASFGVSESGYYGYEPTGRYELWVKAGSDSPAPPGGNGHWYALSSYGDWEEARDEAGRYDGGHLVVVDSPAEQDFLVQQFVLSSPSKNYTAGGYYQGGGTVTGGGTVPGGGTITGGGTVPGGGSYNLVSGVPTPPLALEFSSPWRDYSGSGLPPMTSGPQRQTFWIGLADADRDGALEWVDGTPLDGGPANFDAVESVPGSVTGGDRYVAMNWAFARGPQADRAGGRVSGHVGSWSVLPLEGYNGAGGTVLGLPWLTALAFLSGALPEPYQGIIEFDAGLPDGFAGRAVRWAAGGDVEVRDAVSPAAVRDRNAALVREKQRSATLHDDGGLWITGTAGDDAIDLGVTADGRLGITWGDGVTAVLTDGRMPNYVHVELGDGDDAFTASNFNAGREAGTTSIFVEVDAGAGRDTIVGSDGDDYLFGGDGDDAIYGGGGNDLISGQDGNDYALGGTGDVLVPADGAGVAFDRDTIQGGPGDDTLSGGLDMNDLYGEEGDDLLSGSGGRDSLVGGSGDDRLRGFGNADTLDGGDGRDTLEGDAGAGPPNGGEGNGGDDVLYGGPGADVLRGAFGNDRLFGGPDADLLFGGTGDDTDAEVDASDILDSVKLGG